MLISTIVVALDSASAFAELDASQCSIIDNRGRDAICGTITSPVAYNSARSDPGSANAPIDVWSRCRYVDHSSAQPSVFVPFRSGEEWQAFTDRYPVDLISLTHCARPTQLTIAPDLRCLTATPATQPASLPYARTGATRSQAVQFSCVASGEACIDGVARTWIETALVSYLGLDSDIVDPSWSQTNIVYGGAPPAACVPGQCGSSNGQTLPQAPSDNLCSVGTASTVSGTGPWAWSCDGLNNGVSASCNASAKSLAGECGAANGVAVASSPSSNLCSQGTASSVSGSGPWAWTCAGQYEGSTAHCSAPVLLAPQPEFLAEWKFHDADYDYGSSNIVYQNQYSADQARGGGLPRQMFVPSEDNLMVTANFQNSANCQGKNNAQPPFNGYVQTGTATARISYTGPSPITMQIAWSGCGETQNGYINPAAGVTYEHMGLTVYAVDQSGNQLSDPLTKAQAISVGGHEDNTCGMAPAYSLAPPSSIDAGSLSNMPCPSRSDDFGTPYDLVTIEPGKEYELKIDTSTIDPLYHVDGWYQFRLSFRQ